MIFLLTETQDKFTLYTTMNRQTKMEEYLLLTPGPVLLHSSVRRTLAQPMWHHRTTQFEDILKDVTSDLKKIFQTTQQVLVLNSTGTGAMEAALSNTLSPGDEVICVCAGKFGMRWKEMAMAFGIQVHSINVPLGQAVKPQAIQSKLQEHRQVKAVLISACETSTATEQPIKSISAMLRKYPRVLFIVDGVTAVGAMNVLMDKWGLDVLIAGSQKSFMLPTGLAFIALSQKAWKAVEGSTCPKYYFDLKKERDAQVKGQTAFSSSVTLIRALQTSLAIIKKQGLRSCILKCRALKESTHVFCANLGLAIYSSRPANSVTAIKLPNNLSAAVLQKRLQTYHRIILATGQGALKDKILRIGHLGPIGYREHLKGLKILAMEIKHQADDLFEDKDIKKALKKAKQVLKQGPSLLKKDVLS